ncbi:hypothetical protein [Leifsonia sp. 71-9]|nr:hypothetical protein [Leifsonia sp. 71-9]
MHAEIFISQLSGQPIRVGCLCGERHDHEPRIAVHRRSDDAAATPRTSTR